MRYTFSKEKTGILFLIVSGWVIFQAFWNRDFSFFNTVTLPFINNNYVISGLQWYYLSVLDLIIGISLNTVGLKWVFKPNIKNFYPFVWLIVPETILLLNRWFNHNIFTYGLIWNDILYFVELPILLFANINIIFTDNIIIGNNNGI